MEDKITDLYQMTQDREKIHVPSATWGILKLPRNTAQKSKTKSWSHELEELI